jgi:hypothetical protein
MTIVKIRDKSVYIGLFARSNFDEQRRNRIICQDSRKQPFEILNYL